MNTHILIHATHAILDTSPGFLPFFFIHLETAMTGDIVSMTNDYLDFSIQGPFRTKESPAIYISVIRPRSFFVYEKTMRGGIL